MFIHHFGRNAVFSRHVLLRGHHRVSVGYGCRHGVHEALRVRVVRVVRVSCPLVMVRRRHVTLVVMRRQHALLRQPHARVRHAVIRREATRIISMPMFINKLQE